MQYCWYERIVKFIGAKNLSPIDNHNYFIYKLQNNHYFVWTSCKYVCHERLLLLLTWRRLSGRTSIYLPIYDNLTFIQTYLHFIHKSTQGDYFTSTLIGWADFLVFRIKIMRFSQYTYWWDLSLRLLMYEINNINITCVLDTGFIFHTLH